MQAFGQISYSIDRGELEISKREKENIESPILRIVKYNHKTNGCVTKSDMMKTGGFLTVTLCKWQWGFVQTIISF